MEFMETIRKNMNDGHIQNFMCKRGLHREFVAAYCPAVNPSKPVVFECRNCGHGEREFSKVLSTMLYSDMVYSEGLKQAMQNLFGVPTEKLAAGDAI